MLAVVPGCCGYAGGAYYKVVGGMTCNGIERRHGGWRVYWRCRPQAWFRSLFDARRYYYWLEARCIAAAKITYKGGTENED